MYLKNSFLTFIFVCCVFSFALCTTTIFVQQEMTGDMIMELTKHATVTVTIYENEDSDSIYNEFRSK